MKPLSRTSLLFLLILCTCVRATYLAAADLPNNPPANDDMANAIPVTGATLQDFVHVVSANEAQNATLETDEEECGNQRSWWYVFTPVHTTWYTFSTSDMTTGVSIGVYTGTAHPLQTVACFSVGNPTNPLENSVELTAGTTYYIRTARGDIGGNEDIDTRISRTPFVWTGAESTRWDDADNWQPRSVPADSARVTIPDAGSPPRLRSATVTLLELVLDGGDLGVQPDAFITLLAQNQGLEINNDGRLTLEGDLEVFTDVSPAIDIADGRLFVTEAGTIIASETVRFTEGIFDLEGFLQISSSTGNALEIGERETVNVRDSGELKITTAAARGVVVGPNGNLNVDGQFSVESAGTDGVYLAGGADLSIRSEATALINQAPNSLIACENASAELSNVGHLTLSNPGNFAVNGGQFINGGEGKLIANGVISATPTFEPQTQIEVGASGQCLTFTESASLATANLTLDIAGATACSQYDQIIFAETADINDATLTLRGSYVPQVGESYTLFNNTHSAPITGTLAGLVEGDIITFNGAFLRLSYLGGDGDDIVLTVLGVDAPPANDDLVNAIALMTDEGAFVPPTSGLNGATTEPNEVNCSETVSWWYTYTAPADGEYGLIAGVEGNARPDSENEVSLGIYTGTNHPLVEVECKDDNQGLGNDFEFSILNLSAGETYAIRIGVPADMQLDEIGVVVRRLPATWTGTVSNNWFLAANWRAGLVPDPTSEVVIEAAPNPAVIPSGEVNVAKLEIVNGGDFTLAEGATLTLSGNQEGLEVTNGQATIDGTLNVMDNEFTNVRVNATLSIGATGVMNITEKDITVNDSLHCAGTIILTGGAQMGTVGNGKIVVEETGNVIINEARTSALNVAGGTVLIAGMINITDAGREGIALPLGGIEVTETGSLSVSGSNNFGIDFQFNSNAVIDNRGTVAFFDNQQGAFNRYGRCRNRSGSVFRVEGLIRSDIEFSAGSRLEPGSSPGCITFENATDLGGATVAIEIEGTTACAEYDQITFNATAGISDAELVLTGDYTPGLGESFTLLNKSGTNSIQGAFAGLAEGDTLIQNGTAWRITYAGGDGNDVVITALSEDAPPANDDLINAINIDGPKSAFSNPTNGLNRATIEPGEVSCGETVSWWYSFTPSVSGPYQFIAGSSFATRDDSDNDVTLGVYTGNSHPLTPVGCFTDDQGQFPGGESGTLILESGITYSIRIGVKPNVQVDRIVLFVLQQSVRWVGTVSSDWYNGENWSTGMVPDSGSIISIRSAPNPAILPSGAVHMTRLRLSSDGLFTLAEGAIMRISGTTSTPFITGVSGVQIDGGQATINGTLLISDVEDIGLDTDGGLLTVGATGSVDISEAEEGIANGNFINHGNISIANTVDDAIITATDCTNYGNITLTDIGRDGLDFTGTFTHEGTLAIQNSGDDGIETVGGTLQVGATARITIDSSDDRGMTGLLLINDGIIDITTTNGDGINTAGDGANNGNITLSNIGFDGLDLEPGSTFTNTGTIRILDVSDQALESGLFVQTASGELFITGEITSAMQLAAGSALHPGSSPGCVESTSLTNLAGVELYVELEGPTACAEYDQLQFGDQAVDVTDAELVLSGDYFPADGDVFVILQRSSSSSVSGTFVGLPEEAIIVFNNSLLQINYNNGSGVTLTAVAVLPLDLLSFTGEAREKTNLLTWTTANEEDFSHFEVQRSSAEASASPDLSADWWETIGEIAGGQSGQYSFEDDPITAYYRLKMVDLDGTFTYSEVILLENILGAAAGAMWVYPNPSTGRFTVDLSEVSISFQEAGELRLVDRYGRTVWTRSLAPRQPTPPIELSQRPAGVYLLTLVTDHGQSLTKRIVIR